MEQRHTLTLDQLERSTANPRRVFDETSLQGLDEATVKNVQRENMTPLEESEAVAKLLVEGMSFADVSAQTGLSEKNIRRRLAITELCDEAKVLLANGGMILSQAEALTTGTQEQQRELLDHGHFDFWDAEDVRRSLLGAKPTMSMALFPVEQYSGTFLGDLFMGGEERYYFDDVEQFFRLQTRAVEEKALALEAEGYTPVEVVGRFQDWKYCEAKEGERGGAWIVFHRLTGHVEVHQGLVLEVPTSMDEATNPKAKPTTKYSASLYRYMAMHKSVAVQAGLPLNPRKAKEVAVMRLFTLAPHPCRSFCEDPESAPDYWVTVNDEAGDLLIALGGACPLGGTCPVDIGLPALLEMVQEEDLFERVCALSDDFLDRLHLLLTTMTFGQEECDTPDTDANRLFNRIALDLGTDMSICWTPDEAFLSRRNKQQLDEIVEESGMGHLFEGLLRPAKKSDLVRKLVQNFAKLSTVEQPYEIELEAQRWIPEAMRFPAVDPDAPTTETGTP